MLSFGSGKWLHWQTFCGLHQGFYVNTVTADFTKTFSVLDLLTSSFMINLKHLMLYGLAPKPLDTKDNTLNVECQMTFAPLCIFTATESSVEKYWQSDNETTFLKEILDMLGESWFMKKDFAPPT
jgi:hypothetical protein